MARSFGLGRGLDALIPRATEQASSQIPIERIRRNRTCLAITHRLSLLDRADVAYRLEAGRIVSRPTSLRLVSGQESHGA